MASGHLSRIALGRGVVDEMTAFDCARLKRDRANLYAVFAKGQLLPPEVGTHPPLKSFKGLQMSGGFWALELWGVGAI